MWGVHKTSAIGQRCTARRAEMPSHYPHPAHFRTSEPQTHRYHGYHDCGIRAFKSCGLPPNGDVVHKASRPAGLSLVLPILESRWSAGIRRIGKIPSNQLFAGTPGVPARTAAAASEPSVDVGRAVEGVDDDWSTLDPRTTGAAGGRRPARRRCRAAGGLRRSIAAHRVQCGTGRAMAVQQPGLADGLHPVRGGCAGCRGFEPQPGGRPAA